MWWSLNDSGWNRMKIIHPQNENRQSERFICSFKLYTYPANMCESTSNVIFWRPNRRIPALKGLHNCNGHNIGIQMKLNELTWTFMMDSNWLQIEKPFVCKRYKGYSSLHYKNKYSGWKVNTNGFMYELDSISGCKVAPYLNIINLVVKLKKS